MLFAEIAVQNVTGFPPAGRVPLRPGLNAFVSRENDPFALLRALLDPSEKDAALAGGSPSKVALTIVADDGSTYRLVRDVTGGRTLLRSDPATRQPVKLGDNPADIERYLRTAVGIPPPALMLKHLWLSASDLPSRVPPKQPKPTAPAGENTPPMNPQEARAKLPGLRAELVRAEKFEQMQDGIFQLQQKVEALRKEASPDQLDDQIAELTRKIDALNASFAASPGLEGRIKKYPEMVARKDAQLEALRKKREESESLAGSVPDLSTLTQDPMFMAGAGVGLACVAGALFLGISWLLPLDVVPFGLATFVAWRWVGQVETAEQERRKLGDFGELEKRTIRQFEQETGPVQSAMAALGVATIDVLVSRMEERESFTARLAGLEREAGQRKSDPAALAIAQEKETLQAELKTAEAEYAAMGFTREGGSIRRDLELAEAAANSVEEDPIAVAVDAAAELAGIEPRVLIESFKDRLAQYLAALTDRRFIGVRLVPNGQYNAVAANNAMGPLAGLPPGDRDLIYVALRLALAERVGGPAKHPFVVDEPSVLVDGPHRGLFVQMLKALAVGTQVIVRAFDAPPANMVDHVAMVGATGA